MRGWYPNDLRERAVAAYLAGEGTYPEIAARFSVGRATLCRWVAQIRETGSLEPKPRGGGWRSPVDMALLDELVQEAPDSTTDELTMQYNRHVAAKHRVHRSSIVRALRRAGYVFKKNGRGRQSN